MEELLNYLMQEAKRHKGLVESLPTLRQLADIQGQIKESQSQKGLLSTDLQNLQSSVDDMNKKKSDLSVSLFQMKLSAEAEGKKLLDAAKQEAEGILTAARAQASQIAKDVLVTKSGFETVNAQIQKDIAVARTEFSDWQSKISNAKQLYADLKNKL